MSEKGLFPGWRVVVGSGCGIAFGSVIFTGAAFPLLAAALNTQYNWDGVQLTRGYSLALLTQMISYPIVGWLLDRFGTRRVALASIVLFALCLLALSNVDGQLWRFYGAFFLIGFLASGTNVVSYARAITLWFNRKRGLALGIAASFQAIGAVTLPLLMQKMITSSGLPTAIMAVAAIEILFCLPLVALLVRDDPKPYGLHPDGDASAASTIDSHDDGFLMTGRQILRSRPFWTIAFMFFIMIMCFSAFSINIAFILRKTANFSTAQIAELQAISGVAVLLGRVGFGALLDRFSAAFVGIIALSFAAATFLIAATSTSYGMLVFGAILSGISTGGELDLLPYFAGRYFGKKSVSQIFGWFLCATVLGGAIGPVAFAAVSQNLGSPVTPLYILAALQIIPAVLLLTLGPYPRKNLAPAHQ